MAHIIEPPKPEDFNKVKCRSCRALIGYLPKEIQSYNGKDISGGPDGYTWVDCPNCGSRIVLERW